jgi:hypothetical protein
MSPKDRAAAPIPTVGMFRPTPTVDAELVWFFNRFEPDMGISSNFHAALLAGLHAPRVTPEEAAEASHAHRRIRRWLGAIPDSDAGVLQAAYVQRDWPAPLCDELGRITGVVVRLACALGPWPDDPRTQCVIELGRAHWLVSQLTSGVGRSAATLVRLRREAEVRFARAHHAYAVVRGPGPCLARST